TSFSSRRAHPRCGEGKKKRRKRGPPAPFQLAGSVPFPDKRFLLSEPNLINLGWNRYVHFELPFHPLACNKQMHQNTDRGAIATCCYFLYAIRAVTLESGEAHYPSGFAGNLFNLEVEDIVALKNHRVPVQIANNRCRNYYCTCNRYIDKRSIN